MKTSCFKTLIEGIHSEIPLQHWLTDLKIHCDDLEKGNPGATHKKREDDRIVQIPGTVEETLIWIVMIEEQLMTLQQKK